MKQRKQSNTLLYAIVAIVILGGAAALMWGSSSGQAIRTPYDNCLNIGQQKADLADTKSLTSKIVTDARQAKNVPREFLSVFNKAVQEPIDQLNYRFDSTAPGKAELVAHFKNIANTAEGTKNVLKSMSSSNALVQKELQALGLQLDVVRGNAQNALSCVLK